MPPHHERIGAHAVHRTAHLTSVDDRAGLHDVRRRPEHAVPGPGRMDRTGENASRAKIARHDVVATPLLELTHWPAVVSPIDGAGLDETPSHGSSLAAEVVVRSVGRGAAAVERRVERRRVVAGLAPVTVRAWLAHGGESVVGRAGRTVRPLEAAEVVVRTVRRRNAAGQVRLLVFRIVASRARPAGALGARNGGILAAARRRLRRGGRHTRVGGAADDRAQGASDAEKNEGSHVGRESRKDAADPARHRVTAPDTV